MTIIEGARPLADTQAVPPAGWAGVHIAVVTDNQDPLDQGRVKVMLPWSPDTGSDRYESWARVATMMAGADRGTWFVPDPEDEVLVAFEGGDPRRPVVLGSLWNGQDAPAEQMSDGNPKRTILTGAGVRLTMDDSPGAVSLLLETPGGQRVRLDDTPPSITIEDASGNSVTLESSAVTVTAAVDVKVQAITVNVDAAMVKVTAPMSTFSGTLKADAILTNTIMSGAYLPGAGNIW